MQAIHKQHRPHKKLLLGLLAFLLLAGGAIAFAYTQELGPFSTNDTAQTEDSGQTTNLSEPSDEQVDNGEQIKRETLGKNTLGSSDTNTTTGSDKVPSSVSVSISQPVNGAVVSSDFSVKSIVNTLSSGSCKLKIINGSSTVINQTVKSGQATSYSICGEFSVPISKLGKGAHTIEVSYASIDGSKTGKAAARVVVK